MYCTPRRNTFNKRFVVGGVVERNPLKTSEFKDPKLRFNSSSFSLNYDASASRSTWFTSREVLAKFNLSVAIYGSQLSTFSLPTPGETFRHNSLHQTPRDQVDFTITLYFPTGWVFKTKKKSKLQCCSCMQNVFWVCGGFPLDLKMINRHFRMFTCCWGETKG